MGKDGGRFTYDGQNLLSDGTAFYLNNIGVNTYEGEIYGDRNVAYLKDAIGTVRGELYDHPIVDKLTSVETSFKRFDYTAFGEQINIDANTNDITSGGVHEGIGFTGHYGDSESGLYYARASYLDPSIGRWTVRDSFEDYSPAGLNKYQDCANNPVRYVDPMGQDFFEDVGNFFTGVGNTIVNGITSFMGAIGSGFGYAVNGITAGVGAMVGLFNPEAGQSIINQVAENISRLNTGMNYMWNVATHITESPMALSRDPNINLFLPKAVANLGQPIVGTQGRYIETPEGPIFNAELTPSPTLDISPLGENEIQPVTFEYDSPEYMYFGNEIKDADKGEKSKLQTSIWSWITGLFGNKKDNDIKNIYLKTEVKDLGRITVLGNDDDSYDFYPKKIGETLDHKFDICSNVYENEYIGDPKKAFNDKAVSLSTINDSGINGFQTMVTNKWLIPNNGFYLVPHGFFDVKPKIKNTNEFEVETSSSTTGSRQ
jgi:RHS repeat-associated protein